MQISKSIHEGTEAFTVQGQLNGATASQLEKLILVAIENRVPNFLLDLGQVPLVSSAALRVLLSAAKGMKKHQGKVLLCAMQPEVKQVFDISGLTAFFGVHPTLADALAAIRPAGAAAPPASPPVPTPSPEPVEMEKTEAPTLAPAPPPRFDPVPEPVQARPAPVAPPPRPVAIPPPAAPVISRPVAPPSPPPEPDAAVTVVPPPRAAMPSSDGAATMVPPPAPRRTAPPPPPPPATAFAIPAVTARSPVSSAMPAERSKVPLLVIGGLLALLGLAGGAFFFFSKDRRVSPETQDPRPAVATPTPDAVAAPSPDLSVASPTPELPSAAVESAPPTTGDPAAASASPPTENVTSTQGAVNFDNANAENRSVREAVLQRIDAMPLPPKEKTHLYAALDHARGLGKLLTVSFATGRTEVTPADIENLKTSLRRPDFQRLVNDPTVIFVVLGFADSTGAKQKNKEVSDRRAQSVVATLRGPCGLLNSVQSVGMGDLQILGDSKEKNRVAEVWAVLP